MKYFQLLSAALFFCLASQAFSQSDAGKPSANFYKRYEGTIANQPVVVYLTCEGGETRGDYLYTKIGNPIPLWGNSEAGSGTPPDSLILSERPWGDTIDNVLRMNFVAQDGLIGIWCGNGKTLPINLKESYPMGSYPFTQFVQNDTLRFDLRGGLQDTITSSYAFVLPEDGDLPAADREFITSNIGHYFGCDTMGKSMTLEECVREQSQRYLDSSRVDILADLSSISDTDFANQVQSFQYYESQVTSVRYNEDGILVLGDASSFYAGGAHGMYGVLTHVFDVQNKKELTLSDVTTADSVTLERALEVAFRKAYHLMPNQKLSEILFENYLPPNDNFYITNKGIGFVYDPYEVASYAEGPVEVFVPYSAIRETLTPWFKHRMGL